MSCAHLIDLCCDSVFEKVSDVASVYEAPEVARENFLSLTKELYDLSVSSFDHSIGPLNELYVNGLDSESIWEELQTRNRPLVKYLRKRTGELSQALKKLSENTSNNNEKLKISQNHAVVKSKSKSKKEKTEFVLKDQKKMNVNDSFEDSDDDAHGSDSFGDGDDDYDDDDDNDNDFDGNVLNEDGDDDRDRDNDLNSTQDDELFQMESWLDEAEEFDERHRQKVEKIEKLLQTQGAAEDLSDSDEDDMMLAQRAMYEEEEDDLKANDRKIRYEDFFVDKTKKGKGKSSQTSQSKSSQRYADDYGDEDSNIDDFDDEDNASADHSGGEDGEIDGSNDFEDMEEDDDEPFDSREDVPTTATKLKNKKILSQIEALESELVAPKKWELLGEVKGKVRPENSLLGITAEVERATKSAPIITQEYTSSIEDMIIKRIKDEKFDDIVPREQDDNNDYEEDLALSQEKSSLGLGDIYAEEFLKKSMQSTNSAASKKEQLLTEEVRSLFSKICRELDALSHFQFASRPVVVEPTISSIALPSVAMEDVLPTTESSSSSHAPEEVYEKNKKRAALFSEQELDRDNRKRLRQASKATNKRKKALEKPNPQSKDESLDSDRRIIQGKTSDNDTKSYSKSTEFFSQLQRQSEEKISSLKNQKNGVSNKSLLQGKEKNGVSFKL